VGERDVLGAAQYLAVDVGGTKLAAGVVTAHGEVLARARAETPGTANREALWERLASLVDEVRTSNLAAVGVGCGGPMTQGGETVSPLSFPAWRDFPLRDRLARHTGLPTFVDNDAKAVALAEGWIGAARGVGNYIGMVVSTGIGGGVVLNGQLLDGATGNAGHIGHVIVEPDGHQCRCGARGCVEAEASGTAIASLTGSPPSEAPPEIVERCGRLVGRAIADVANLLDLDLAVVAGSVALGFGDPFFTAAQTEISDRCRLKFARDTRVVPAQLGDLAPLIGAARIAIIHGDT
jgi:glucokinase